MSFVYGADYYPEHWEEERWQTDARMMQEAGINTVRMAEFAWTKMEPRPGVFTFDWLDRAIALLGDHGIQTVLGTPTASPPAWLMETDVTQYRVMEDGRRQTYGARREYCPTHSGYRAATERIVTAMAEHYADNPNVIGWQTDNEFGENCFCDLCRAGFQDWLKVRYGSLQALNAAWGTEFWSHTYQAWSEIPAMLETGAKHNPGLELDWKRYMSDTWVDYQNIHIRILREKAPKQFITHNLMGFNYDHINYFDFAAPLDFVSWDNYVRVFWDRQITIDMARIALNHDAMRGLKRKPFWVMEQQGGPTGGDQIGGAPRPGEIRLWAYQDIAHGADGVVYFRWRTCRFGSEEYWHGILDHHGEPTRRYREVSQMGRELQSMGDHLTGTMPKAQVAMMLSYDVRFAFQSQPIHPQFAYTNHFLDLYRAFWQRNVMVDVVDEFAENLKDYKLVVLPAFYVLTDKTAALLKEYVAQGGTILCTGRTGVKDESNTVVNLRLPGLLREVCGVSVEEYDALPPDDRNTVIFDLPGGEQRQVPVTVWTEWLEPEGAQVLARYGQDYMAGQAAVTVNQYGQGKAVYAGVFGDTTLFAALNEWLLPAAGVQVVDAPAGVEVTRREKDGECVIFILNHTNDSVEVSLPGRYTDLISGKTMQDVFFLPPMDVLVLKEG